MSLNFECRASRLRLIPFACSCTAFSISTLMDFGVIHAIILAQLRVLLSKFLFLHHNFPGQFRFVADYLADQGHDILFLTETNFVPEITKIKTLQVPFSKSKDSSVGRQLSTAESFRQVMISLLEEGYYPDFIISHSGWGCGLHSKEIFPNAKKVSYLEWWFSPHAKEYEYDNDGWCFYGEKKGVLRYRNMPVSLELSESDFIVSPTKWQRDQLPRHLYLRQSHTKV